jgi:hypothetical protein
LPNEKPWVSMVYHVFYVNLLEGITFFFPLCSTMFYYVLVCFSMFYYVSQLYKRLHPTCFICGPGFDMFRTGRRLQQCHLQPLARNNYH